MIAQVGGSGVMAERIAAQGLAGERARSAAVVAERLLAVQGQNALGVRLAVRARSEGLGVGDVDRALSEERSLLISWLNRGTLHLVRSEDFPLLQMLTTPPLLTSSARRLRQVGIGEAMEQRAMATIERSLADEGPLTRAQLRERLVAAGVKTEDMALVHLCFAAAVRGLFVRGPMVGREHAYALVHDWLGAQPRLDRAAALAELTRRYLVGHGPADDRDLARWAGLPLRDARAGLGAIAPLLRQREDGLVDLAALAPKRPPALPAPMLLGAFDPLLLGWTSRTEIIGPHRFLATNNGIFRPFALVNGRAVAAWRFDRGRVEVEHLEHVPKRAALALELDAADVERFLAA